MPGFENLSREYEARRFSPARTLDVHGEGPAVARDRALRWIQSYAHEEPGVELLLVVERGTRPGARAGAVRSSVERMLEEITGGLIERWSPFTVGTIAVRVSLDPRMVPPRAREAPAAEGDGRTPETASAAQLPPEDDIPEDLLPLAGQIAEMRRDREGVSVGATAVFLRRVWIEAQAIAMAERVSLDAAMERLLSRERARVWEG